jgi:ArsR family transcriptional regulator, lead/cadmium/zinc/bismuth-responsive transcriptional repressor
MKEAAMATKDVPICDCTVIHQEVIDGVAENMPGKQLFMGLTELFKAFGDNTRLKIIYALSESEMCVCDLSALLGMTQSAISHQLRVLKNTGLLKYDKKGKIVYYSLDDEHVRSIFQQGIEHVGHIRR